MCTHWMMWPNELVVFAPRGLRVHYAMKANALPRLLCLLRDEGVGVDVVSLGEMQKALSLGFSPAKIIFSGVAKDREELLAAVQQEIYQINIESFEELRHLAILAESRRNPGVGRFAGQYSTCRPPRIKYTNRHGRVQVRPGCPSTARSLSWLKARPQIQLKGLAVHIGSQILDVAAFANMSEKTGELYRDIKARGFPLERLDLGGGLGIDYHSSGAEDFGRLDRYLTAVTRGHGTDARIHLEPGRFLVARMGVLLAKVVYIKRGVERTFAVLNAGMNALMRPSLYQAYHRIEPLSPRTKEREVYSVVGPICESTDTFAEAREMPKLEAGDWVAVFDAGAYGASMANTYNESPFPEQWSVFDDHWRYYEACHFDFSEGPVHTFALDAFDLCFHLVFVADGRLFARHGFALLA
ncbi:MAG: diaminopimelate decarboxylase [Calothrix sp. SM1_5_4]|nr:diaminopimelate decarboxylase [Calothrix sp. SM1_5_4]